MYTYSIRRRTGVKKKCTYKYKEHMDQMDMIFLFWKVLKY